jgi:SAM-dependent methyltransferase
MPARELTAEQRESRNAILARLGVEPSLTVRLRAVLDTAIHEARRQRPDAELVVLDAGCGRKSPLAPFRGRIDRLVGADLHAPDPPLSLLDSFVATDLCQGTGAFADDSFGLILSNFTLEHFHDPPTAFANFFRWLKPGGMLVLTTVNRRHPFVAAYLGLPPRARRPLQTSIKLSHADAHPLIGICNDPDAIIRAMTSAGFERIELETIGHLARSWVRRWPAFALGAVGDVAAQRSSRRRSTIIATGRKPNGSALDVSAAVPT